MCDFGSIFQSIFSGRIDPRTRKSQTGINSWSRRVQEIRNFIQKFLEEISNFIRNFGRAKYISFTAYINGGPAQPCSSANFDWDLAILVKNGQHWSKNCAALGQFWGILVSLAWLGGPKRGQFFIRSGLCSFFALALKRKGNISLTQVNLSTHDQNQVLKLDHFGPTRDFLGFWATKNPIYPKNGPFFATRDLFGFWAKNAKLVASKNGPFWSTRDLFGFWVET